MGLLSWLRSLFKHRKPEATSWTKPYAKSCSTIESRISTCQVKATLTEAGKSTHVRIEPTPTTPITHPARYGKFFKKRRRPTTARKLWKKNAKIEDDEDEDDVNVIFREDD